MNFFIFAGVKILVILLLFLASGVFIRFLDRLIFPGVPFEEELRDANGAVAIVVAAALLAWGIALGLILG